MKEAKHFLKATTLVLYATFVSLNPAIVCATDRLNPGELLRAETEQQITSANHQYRLIMQRDGNLVLYLSNGQPAWSSNTFGKPGSFLLVQNDGNMVIYQPQAVWASNTAR
jgi:hypothetical protein